jgi:hypothetical protein
MRGEGLATTQALDVAEERRSGRHMGVGERGEKDLSDFTGNSQAVAARMRETTR